MNTARLLATCIWLILINQQAILSQDHHTRDQDVILVVEQSMHEFLHSIPDAFIAKYGINNKADIQIAHLSKPIPVFHLSGDSMHFSNTWRVPLLIRDEHASLFTVSCDSTGRLTLVDFGAALLSREIQARGHGARLQGLLRVHALRMDFLILSQDMEEWVYEPLPYKQAVYSLQEILDLIK